MMLLDAISECVEPVSIGLYRAQRLFLIILNIASMELARMIVDAPSRDHADRPSVRVPYSGHGFRWASSSVNSV
jgi:hypothetical protein